MIFDSIWRFERKLKRLNRDGMRQIHKAATSGLPQEEIWDVIRKEWMQYQGTQEEMLSFRSRQLISEAEHLALPVPRGDDKFDEGRVNKGLRYLKVDVLAQLRKDIRQERKERREMWTTIIKDAVVPLGGIVISVLSLLIAYAALKIKALP